MVDQDSSTQLISFLQHFTKLTEEQLLSVRETMVSAVETVMKGVEGISQATEDKREQAEKVLESTFVNPDAETEVLIQDLQKVVDDLFEKSASQIDQGSPSKPILSFEPEVLVRNRINRLNGKFEGDMKSLEQLDQQLGSLLFGIIGTLSAEDVIAQKIDHVTMSLRALQTGLSYLLIDYEHRCRPADIERVTDDIKDLTFRQYTTEDEKVRFRSHFGPEKKAS